MIWPQATPASHFSCKPGMVQSPLLQIPLPFPLQPKTFTGAHIIAEKSSGNIWKSSSPPRNTPDVFCSRTAEALAGEHHTARQSQPSFLRAHTSHRPVTASPPTVNIPVLKAPALPSDYQNTVFRSHFSRCKFEKGSCGLAPNTSICH